VYDAVARPVVDGVIGGYNGCVMAYGQTGSGKTYTLGNGVGDSDTGLLGDPNAGVVPRALEHIFGSARPGAGVRVHISYVQIYCEMIQDLLDPATGTLRLRGDGARGGEEVNIEGATEVRVRSVAAAIDHVRRGNKNRVTALTNLNAASSRSHAVLIVRVERRVLAVAGEQQQQQQQQQQQPHRGRRTVGKLMLVDLAGSERMKKSRSEGLRASEARSINLSLTCLGNVVRALSDERQTHIPFRESKLTRLLQPALSGGAKVSLVVTVGPSPAHILETVSSLSFGQRAMQVQTYARVNFHDDTAVDLSAVAYNGTNGGGNSLADVTRFTQLDMDARDDEIDALRARCESHAEREAELESAAETQREAIATLEARCAELTARLAATGSVFSDEAFVLFCFVLLLGEFGGG
jgi:kinesin family protein 5